ncbi:hypothetical protein BGW38_005824 [Lunasporangiospora selenospora]|uniref:Lysine methyltransferase n=1 Tax=Lunasporangiospora selenospora TaxID=979761 RepID=A0A9P6G366_9FUNG|nr:hypothetical protein BGW38_005824 [Lunasporangiospora selenospora]
MLMIEGPKFPGYDFSPRASQLAERQDLEPFVIKGHRVVLPSRTDELQSSQLQQEGANHESETLKQKDEQPLSHTASTAKSVWDCSIVLGKYMEALEDKTPGYWSNKNVLELGAGQGIVSLSAAALGVSKVIVTDVSTALPDLQEGVQLNGFTENNVHVVELDWTSRDLAVHHISENLLGQEKSLDFILASDVVWVDYLVPHLVDTIADLMKLRSSQGSSPTLLLAYQVRSLRSDRVLFESLDKLGLKREKVRFDGGSDADNSNFSVFLDFDFRKPDLAIWRFWKEE